MSDLEDYMEQWYWNTSCEGGCGKAVKNGRFCSQKCEDATEILAREQRYMEVVRYLNMAH